MKTRLSIMMFLQYAIWGSWTTALAVHLVKLGFSGQQIGAIYGCMWLACMIAPFIGGQLVDRLMPTQMFLALAHITGGALLYLTAIQAEFGPMWRWMFIYCLFYAPTLALTNSICFRNLSDAEVEFGRIRMWGTVGWIAVGDVVPGGIGAEFPEDSVEDGTLVDGRATAGGGSGYQRLDKPPLFVGQVHV